MKSELTPEQARKMYGQKKEESLESKQRNMQLSNPEIKIKEGTDVVLVEVAGKNHRLPTWYAFNRLINENKELKNEIQKTLREVKSLKDVIRHIGRNVDHVNDELKNKIDKP